MSDCSLSSVSSSVSHSRTYKCGACGGIGHNRRSCSSVTKAVVARKTKEPEPEIDLLSFVPLPAPAPAPAPAPKPKAPEPKPKAHPPSPPSSVSTVAKKPSDVGYIFRLKAKHASPTFLLLRTLYNNFPEQFSIHTSLHASKHEEEEHITILHSYTYFLGDDTEKTAYAYYHAYFNKVPSSQGTKSIWTRFTAIDAYKNIVVLAEFSAPL